MACHFIYTSKNFHIKSAQNVLHYQCGYFGILIFRTPLIRCGRVSQAASGGSPYRDAFVIPARNTKGARDLDSIHSRHLAPLAYLRRHKADKKACRLSEKKAGFPPALPSLSGEDNFHYKYTPQTERKGNGNIKKM